MSTPSLKSSEISRQWYIVDASELPLGRLSSEIAKVLSGKQKPTFTPHIDNGDYVIVVNAKNLVVKGNKLAQKKYYRHSGHMGGLKETNLEKMLETKPEKVIELAVKGMIAKNKLQSGRMNRLKVYAEAEHEHSAQTPKPLPIDKKGKK